MSTLKQRMTELSPNRRKKVQSRTAQLVAEEMTLLRGCRSSCGAAKLELITQDSSNSASMTRCVFCGGELGDEDDPDAHLPHHLHLETCIVVLRTRLEM